MAFKTILRLGLCLPLLAQAGQPTDSHQINNHQQLFGAICGGSAATAASELQVSAARERLDAAGVDKWLPDVDLSVEAYSADGEPTSFFALNSTPEPDAPQPDVSASGEVWEGKVNLNWALYDEGRWVGQSDLGEAQASSEFAVAQSELTRARSEALKLAAQYYFDALMYSAQVDLLEPFASKRKTQLADVEKKLGAGVRTRVDFYAAKAAYLGINEQLKQAIRQRDKNIGYLKLLSQTPITLPTLGEQGGTAELAQIESLEIALENPEQLVKHQPDVTNLSAKLQLEREKLSASSGKLLPSLNLFVRGRSAESFDTHEDRQYGEVGLAVEYPLGAVAKNSGESKALRRSVEAISSELDYLMKVKMLQATQLSDELASAKNSIEVKAAELARRNQLLLSDQQKLQSGLVGLDALIDSEDDKIQAELNLLGAYRDAWKQYVDTLLFTGQACAAR